MSTVGDPHGQLLRLLIRLRRRPEQRADDTRRRILSEAIELFAARGYAGTSMRDIAASVGIKPASIYAHFDAKHEILCEALSDVLYEFQAFVTEPLQPDQEPIDQLRILIERHALWQLRFAKIAGSWDVVWDIDRLANTLSAEARDAITDQRDLYHDLLAALVARVRPDDPDPRVTAEVLVALCDRASAWGASSTSLTDTTIPAAAWRFAVAVLIAPVAQLDTPNSPSIKLPDER